MKSWCDGVRVLVTRHSVTARLSLGRSARALFPDLGLARAARHGLLGLGRTLLARLTLQLFPLGAVFDLFRVHKRKYCSLSDCEPKRLSALSRLLERSVAFHQFLPPKARKADGQLGVLAVALTFDH